MEKVNLRDLVWEQEVYPRAKLDGETVKDYIEALKSGAKFPALKVQKITREVEDKEIEGDKDKEKEKDKDKKAKEIEQVIILDGVHRFEAYKGFNEWLAEKKKEKEENKEETKSEENDEELQLEEIKQVEVDYWREDRIDYDKYSIDVFYESILENIGHGNRLTMKHKKENGKRLAEKYVEEQENGKEFLHSFFAFSRDKFRKFIAKDLAVTYRGVCNWTEDIFEDVINERDNLIYSLSQLGWAQSDIAKAVVEAGFEKKYGQVSVSQRILLLEDIHKVINLQYYKMNKSIEDIVKENRKSRQLIWSILLEGKEDKERMEEINNSLDRESKDESEEEKKIEKLELKRYDGWNYSGCNKLMGIKYDGQIPGQILINVLHYYTKLGDLVIDPLAGGGVTNDACLLFGRKCYSYDIDPSKSKRKDIIKFKISPDDDLSEEDEKKSEEEKEKIRKKREELKESFKRKLKKASLIFIDPPYWSMKDKDYPEGSWSGLSYEDFCQRVEWFTKELYEQMKPGAHVAWIIQNQTEKDLEGKAYINWIRFSSNKLVEVGFEDIREISCNQSTQCFLPQQVEKAKKEDRMLGIVRNLLIFKKVEKKEKNDKRNSQITYKNKL